MIKNWHKLDAEFWVIGERMYGIPERPTSEDPGFPSRAELKHLLSRLSLVEIGKRFNVGPKQVEEWMRVHKISLNK